MSKRYKWQRARLKGYSVNFKFKRAIQKGEKWTAKDVGNVLNKATYYGAFQYRSKSKTENEELITSQVEAIVTEKTFKQVEKALESRRPKNTKSKGVRSPNLLTGILKCPACDCNMGVMVGNGTGGQYEYYKCRNKLKFSNFKCETKNVRKDKIERLVCEVVLKELLTEKKISQLMNSLKLNVKKRQSSNQIKLASLSKNLVKSECKIENLYEQVSLGEMIVDSFFKKHMDKLKKQSKYYTEEIDVLKKKTSLPFKKFGSKQVNLFINVLKN